MSQNNPERRYSVLSQIHEEQMHQVKLEIIKKKIYFGISALAISVYFIIFTKSKKLEKDLMEFIVGSIVMAGVSLYHLVGLLKAILKKMVIEIYAEEAFSQLKARIAKKGQTRGGMQK